MTALISVGQAGQWIWFGIAWLFILAVVLKHWYDREHRDAKATGKELKRTRQSTDTSHIWDAT